MATVLQHKVVAALPSPLEPDSIYYVRVGQGFDVHVTNGLGEVVAYGLNAQIEVEALPDWSTAETASAALTALGMSASGKAVATGTPAQGRAALALGTAATRDVTTSATDTTSGRLLRVGDFGLGRQGWMPSQGSDLNNYIHPGFYGQEASAGATNGTNYPVNAAGGLTVLPSGAYYSNSACQLYTPFNENRVFYRGAHNGEFRAWVELRHTGNTTVDSNGFIKAASPIIKLHSDRMETEAGGTFERLGTGHYRITGCNGLRLTDGWYIETPHDRNKNPYFNIEWEQDIEPNAEAGVLEEPADVTLTIRCYERVWNPQTGTYDNGDPVDIPDGRWIDLRMNEVRQPEPEEPEDPIYPDVPDLPPEPTEPSIPSVVTMAQAKLALLYAGLYEQVEQALADLPEPLKSAALIEWNHRQTLEREHPLVAQVATALELTEQQLDELFVDASGR